MASVKILGSAYATPNTQHENTHFVLQGSHGNILVDCGANPTVRLEQAGISFDSIEHVIFTHFHPDHVGGAPLMLMSMWLMGRTKPLNIYGLEHCLNNLQQLMGMYSWNMWPKFYEVNWHVVPDGDDQLVYAGEDFHITGWPATHFVPTLALRIRDKSAGRVLAYTCDGSPCESLNRMAVGANTLLHEAAGEGFGHSSAVQAGQLAGRVGAEALYLIHYDVHQRDQHFGGSSDRDMIGSARQNFSGRVEIVEDFTEFEI